MKYQIIKLYQGELLGDEKKLSFFQLCNQCNLSPEIVIDLVDEGILEPEGKYRGEWRFSVNSIHRAQKARRLQEKFELNLNSAALIIMLLDRIEELEKSQRNIAI